MSSSHNFIPVSMTQPPTSATQPMSMTQPYIQTFVDANAQPFLSQPTQITYPTSIPPTVNQFATQQILSQPIIPTHQNTVTFQPSSFTQVSNDWRTVENKKKRIRSPEKNVIRKQTTTEDYWLNKPVVQNNRYEALMDEETDDTESQNTPQKPPPITIYGVNNITPLHDLLQKMIGRDYIIKANGADRIKLQLLKPEHYKPVIESLDKNQTEYHTYQIKQDKAFRVVARGIHYSTNTDSIVADLKAAGHEVVNVWNIKHRTTKQPLPLFYLDIKSKDNNKDIYKIKEICQNSVTIEPPHVKRVIPQCIKCQSYGHTKNFCHRTPRCVKCAGLHLTENCLRKDRDNNVMCANCNGNHPANYRGCLIHKQLQEKMFPALRQRRSTPTTSLTLHQQPNIIQHQQQYIPINEQPENRPSYSQAVTNTPYLQTDINLPVTSPTNANEINELKDLLKELIEQNKENARNMSTMLNLLTTLVTSINNGSVRV